MSAAFADVIGLSTPADVEVFQKSQQAWLDDRDTDCDTDGSERQAKRAAIAECATRENNERYRYLAGLPDEGPGAASRIVPVMRYGHGFIWSFHFAAPTTAGEKLLNDKLDGEVAHLHIGTAEDDYSDNFDAELTYASPTFLSAAVVGDHLGGEGKDNQPFAYTLNIDMRSGKLLDFSDAFAPDDLPKLQGMCAAELKDYLTPVGNETVDDVAAEKSHLYAAVADLGQWSFGAKRASINMTPGDEDPYICHFDYGYLRKIIKQSFPLPN